MAGDFSNLPREIMVKEFERQKEKLDLAARLLGSQGEIINQLRIELKVSEKTNRELIETIKELNNNLE